MFQTSGDGDTSGYAQSPCSSVFFSKEEIPSLTYFDDFFFRPNTYLLKDYVIWTPI